MKKRLTKRTNRLISIICICIFGFSLVCLGTVLYNIYNTYQEHIRLEEEYKKIQEEEQYIKSMLEKIGADGYLNVYSSDEMVEYNKNNEPIIIIIGK